MPVISLKCLKDNRGITGKNSGKENKMKRKIRALSASEWLEACSLRPLRKRRKRACNHHDDSCMGWNR